MRTKPDTSQWVLGRQSSDLDLGRFCAALFPRVLGRLDSLIHQ